MWAPNGNVASPWSKSPSAARTPGSVAVAEHRGRRVGGASGELGPRQRRRGHAGDADRPGVRVDDDVGVVRLQQVGGEVLGLLDEQLGGVVHRRAAELQRP